MNKSLIKSPVLSDSELYEGLIKTFSNAELLKKEADLLSKEKYYCRSYTLYQLALEELGKCKILSFYLIEYYNSNYVTPKILQENSGFKDHRKKTRIMYMTVLSVMDWYIKDTGNVPPDYNSTQSDFQNDRQSDEKKNQSLYVCFNNNKFISPSESITEQDCLKMQYKVKVYIQLIKVSLIEPKEYYPLLAKALKKAKEKYGKSEEVRPVNPNIAKL